MASSVVAEGTNVTVTTHLRRIARVDALVLVATLWFLGKFLRYAFPPLFGTLGDTYGVSPAVLGAAFSALLLVYAGMQFPSGYLADTFGPARVLAAGGTVAALGAAVLVTDSPFPVLVVAMLLLGVGTGTFKTVGIVLLSQVYTERTGRVLGVFDTFGTFGGAAAPVAIVLVAGLPVFGAPWRTLFLLGGLACIALVVGIVLRVPRRLSNEAVAREAAGDGVASTADSDDGVPSDTAGHTSSVRANFAPFRDPRFATFVAASILFGFAYNGTIAFLPLYLVEEAGLATTTANVIFSGLFVVGLVQLVTGEVSDRTGALPIIAILIGLTTAGIVAILVLSPTSDPILLGGAVVVLGVGAHGYRPLRGVYLMQVLPESIAGGSLGVVRTMVMGVGAISPTIVGVLLEQTAFAHVFWLVAAVLAVATALTVALITFE